ncbi:hypothetical protein ACJJTC_006939 [Scirpophaga incertulas]
MDVEITALLLYYYQRRKKMKRKKKKIWVHPFVSNRSQSGVFLKLYEDLRKYPEKMLNYLRMSLTAVRDEACGLHENLMRPYGGHNLSYKQRIFNYRLSRARRYIECTFGILSNKWRIFHRPLNVNIDLAKKIVKTRFKQKRKI